MAFEKASMHEAIQGLAAHSSQMRQHYWHAKIGHSSGVWQPFLSCFQHQCNTGVESRNIAAAYNQF